MNIVIESSSTPILSYIISIAAIIFPGLLAIAIFIWTGSREKKKEKGKEIRKIKENNTFLQTNIDGIEKASQNQIYNLDIFLSSLKGDLDDSAILNIVSGFCPIEIFTISRTDLYKTLVLSRDGDIIKKQQLFFKFISNVLLLIDIKNDINTRITELYMEYTNHIDLLNSYIKNLMTFHDELIPENRLTSFSLPEDLFYKKIDKIIDDYSKSNKNIYEINHYLIAPLTEIINNPNIPYDGKMKTLTDIVRDLNYQNMKCMVNLKLRYMYDYI